MLKILLQQGGTELRLASDRRPQMFKGDAELPLTMPAMSTERICELLDELWTAHATTVRRQGQLSVTYSSAELGRFALMLVQRDDATLEVRFRRDGHEARADDDAARSAQRGHAVAGATTNGAEEAGEAATFPAAFVAVLTRAAAHGATDIHLSPQRPPIVRINGALQVFEGVPGFDATALVGGQDRLERLRAGGSVDRAFEVPGAGRV